jgi:hypothetical protein
MKPEVAESHECSEGIAGLSPSGNVTINEDFVTGLVAGVVKINRVGRSSQFRRAGTLKAPGSRFEHLKKLLREIVEQNQYPTVCPSATPGGSAVLSPMYWPRRCAVGKRKSSNIYVLPTRVKVSKSILGD